MAVTMQERKQIQAETLIALAQLFNEGAAGQTDYWFRQMASRLIDKSKELSRETVKT